jgi:uncharacterized BrkB/YihY/UPF0761 family membrane protein
LDDDGSRRQQRRLAARRDQLRARVAAARARVEQARPRSKVLDTAFTAVERDLTSGGGVLAAAVAFRIFLFQVPYVFTLVAGFGLASDAASSSPTELARRAGIGGLTAQAVSGVAGASRGTRWSLLIVGGVALFLAARAAVKVLRVVHSLVWGVPITPMRRRNLAALVFVGIVTAALALVSLLGRVRSETLLGYLVLFAVSTAVPVAAWLYISLKMPHASGVTWTALLPGSVLFAIGTQALHVVTVVWIAHSVSSKTNTYGAIGSALALLLWAYLLGRIVIAAVALNAALWSRGRGAAAPAGAPPGAAPIL